MLPPRLNQGDKIRIIAPARSLSIVYDNVLNEAVRHLRDMGYRVSFSKNCREIGYADSASVEQRVEDIHAAFSDSSVKAILCAVGGFNSNQLLEYIDYSLIENDPKIICGMSDITAILNAIYAKTGLVTYHGPVFAQFGHANDREYTDLYFNKCLSSDSEIHITPSEGVKEYTVIQEGYAEGTIIGGNLCTLNLLQGTEYMPSLHDTILFIEDDNIMGEYFTVEFERNLQSLLQVKDLKIAGIVFGRFAEDCGMSKDVLTEIVITKRQLRDIPIVFGADFGHVTPFFTFPIGGRAKVTAIGDRVDIIIK